jgi:hypothetical protein
MSITPSTVWALASPARAAGWLARAAALREPVQMPVAGPPEPPRLAWLLQVRQPLLHRSA